MKFPKIKIVKLEEGKTNKAVPFIRGILIFNIFLCSYYIYQNLPKSPDPLELENSKLQEEAKELS